MTLPILSIPIEHEQDVVIARRRARQVAALLKFDAQDQTRIATAVSEIVRNAFTYGGGGRAEFLIEKERANPALSIRVSDRGPGIQDVDLVLSGSYQSKTGMGAGLIGARRLMDSLKIDSQPGTGTTVLLSKKLSPNAPPLSPKSIGAITQRLSEEPQDFFEEVRTQNQELLRALEEAREAKAAVEERKDELIRLNRELEETNRGVVALYAELDERAERLRNADAMKSRFLSYVSHEFRTPLNGIIGLTRLLLDRHSVRADDEAGKQVRFVQQAAEELAEMVNDLLDLAKAEAGKLNVQPVEFAPEAVFGTLRGLFRPLQQGEVVSLIIEEPRDVPPLRTDETKLAQILRNLVSNALKFTERGEVRVTAKYDAGTDSVTFDVRDTGIGIPPDMQAYIFDEFAQIDHPLQMRNKGTGLGLPLCKRLAELLGGSIAVESSVGGGSLFKLTLPRLYRPALLPERRRKVLIVDDEEISRYLLRALLPQSCEVVEARDGKEGIRLAQERRPDLIFLDLKMPDLSGVEVLKELRASAITRDIPVVIATSYEFREAEVAASGCAVVAVLSKDTLARSEGLTIEFGPSVFVTVRPKQAGVHQRGET